MSAKKDESADLLRQFEAAISGMELDDLRGLANGLLWGDADVPPERPELRRPRRKERVTYRIRVDLDGSKPPIWRRLDLRSDLTLNVVHEVLQAAFAWEDRHLYRFSLGGDPFDRTSQLFLCPYDIDSGEVDDNGLPTHDVRIDETLHVAGDALRYCYDYGDSWELTLRLEEVLRGEENAPAAIAVGGRRAAPPEDCGGMTDAVSVADVLSDPAHLDLDEVNAALREPHFVLRDRGIDGRLVDLIRTLSFTDFGDDLIRRTLLIADDRAELPRDEMVAALAAFQWFLDRAVGEGIPLTQAGYLRPVDVEAAAQVVPEMADWLPYGSNNRETNAAPVLNFRQSLQRMGLLRKRKGSLLLTCAGAKAQRDPGALWKHLAARLVPSKPKSFDEVASLLLLLYAGSSSPGEPLPLQHIAESLTELDWRTGNGTPIGDYAVYSVDAWRILQNVGTNPPVAYGSASISPAAAALARTALRGVGA